MPTTAPLVATPSSTTLGTWFGWLGSIAGIIGLIATIYFYNAARRYRDLAYYVQPIKIAVVSAEHVSDLRVFYRDKEVKEVTTVQVVIWNRGNEPIRPEHVIDAIKIKTEPAKPILKATVVRVTRPLVSFTCDQTELGVGKVPVSWKILEQGDGAVVQLIYAGSPITDIVLEGAVEGQRKIDALKYGGKIESASEQMTKQRRVSIKFLLSSSVLVLIGIVLAISVWRSFDHSLSSLPVIAIVTLFVASLLASFLLFGLSLHEYLSIQPPIPWNLG